MTSKYQKILNGFYQTKHIHPEDFHCLQQNTCRQYAYQGNMTETKMSMVGSLYGEKYPRIVVVSLDPPSGKNKENELKNKRWEFIDPHQRTTEFVSSTHEKDDFSVDKVNTHWAMTQIIVKDILELWGYKAHPNAAVVLEEYGGRIKENVSAYFAHVNVAKCSMNNEGQRKGSVVVHQTCSKAYLQEELILLEPDILITQGADTNEILGRILVGREMLISDLPKNQRITLGGNQILWLPMHHPARQLDKIRALWPTYLRDINLWVKSKKWGSSVESAGRW
jgi:hypothetical protein